MSSKNDHVLKIFEGIGLIFTGPFIIALWAWAWSWYLLSGFDFRVGQQSKTADSIIIKRIKAERIAKEMPMNDIKQKIINKMEEEANGS